MNRIHQALAVRLTSALIGALLAPAFVALSIVGIAAPAHAAGCTGSTGVTVVVDHHQLGAGVKVACDADGGGKDAATIFQGSSFPLTRVGRFPGAVCRVGGLPADAGCQNMPPNDAYWSLYWSDGKSGTWTFASAGVDSTRIPDGGYVAWSWQGQTSKAIPGYAATPRVAPPSSPPPATPNTPAPPKPTNDPKPPKATTPADPGTPGATGTTAPVVPGAPTTTPGAPKTTGPVKPGKPGKTPKPGKKTPSSTAPSATSTDSGPTTVEGTATSDVAEDKQESGRLPWWLIVLVFAGLGGGAAVIAVQRKNASP